MVEIIRKVDKSLQKHDCHCSHKDDEEDEDHHHHQHSQQDKKSLMKMNMEMVYEEVLKMQREKKD